MIDAVIVDAAAEYARHKAWRLAGREPWRCPGPTAEQVIDAELDALQITDRAARDRIYTIWAQQALDMAESERTEPNKYRSGWRSSPIEPADTNDLPLGGRFSHSRGE